MNAERGAASADGAPGAVEGTPLGLPDRAFRTIVDSISLPITVCRADGTIIYAGGNMEQWLGWAPHEVVGRNVVDFVPPDQLETALASLGDLLQHEQLGLGVPVVFGTTRRDGSVTWAEIGAVPLLDDPDVQGIVLYHLTWDAELQFDEFLSALLAGDPLDEVLARLCRSIATGIEAVGAVVHHGFDGSSFLAESGHGVPTGCLDTGGSPGPWHRAAATGEPVFSSTTELAGPAAAAAEAAGIGGCWAIPLAAMDGLAPAVLSVWRQPPTAPVTAHQFMIRRSLKYVQLALVRWAEHQRLAHLAGHDSLTGVANRAVFRDHLAEALAIGESEVAVAFCDIDDFKGINDTHGHSAGDAVLIEVSNRLESAMRVGDHLARIGGDEFTVLLRNIPDREAAGHMGERLLSAMREPVPHDGEAIHVGLSIGLALAEPGMTADALVAAADAALYQVKHSGKGAAQVAEPTIR